MKTKQQKTAKPIPKDSKFHCSAEWHLSRLKTMCAGLIYTHAMMLAKRSHNYYCSQRDMAEYFDKNRRTIAAAFQELVSLGFFEEIRADAGKAVNYRPVKHTEWAEKHPNQCVEKLAMPWDGEDDPLGRDLYAVSGGRVKAFFPNVLKSFRKIVNNDAAIITAFKEFWPTDDGSRGVVRRFGSYLRVKFAYRPPASDAPEVVHAMHV